MDWQGNMGVQVQIGTGFWIFLTILVVALLVWRSGLLPKVKKATADAFKEEFASRY
jgi:Sec-independent protein translocase protein TatA